MAGFFNQFLQQLGTGDEIKDYRHASKTFVESLYRLGPKSTALFHVFIETDSSVIPVTGLSDVREIGLMAKTVQLPKFSIQNKTYNAYNRKNIVQERINYDPVTITFHDDSANVVRNFWYDYYAHYYRDSDHNSALYNTEHKYAERQSVDWGYSPNNPAHYIKAIRIYSLHQKSFSSYVLFRPTITSFQHGQHTAGEYGLLEHSMTVAYEAVHYEEGSIVNGNVMGFGELHYDKSPSPLASLGGGTTSVLGPGGLVQNASDIVKNLNDGNLFGAAIGSYSSYRNFKNANLKDVVGAELKQVAMDILRGQGTQTTIIAPTAAAIKKTMELNQNG